MSEKTNKWIDAANQIFIDPKAKVVCPECNKGLLILKIEPFGDYKEDWYFICNTCGKWNVATKSASK